jgi:tetratricopeptide (TPR) repeat protein
MIEKKYREALDPLLKVPESAPQYFQARLWAASIWEAQDKMGAAASEYRKLIDLDRKDARPYLRLAELLERKGDLGPALEYYRKYLGVVPESVNSEAVHWKIKTLEARASQTPTSVSNPAAGQTPQARTTVPVKLPEVKPAAADKKPEEEGRAASIKNDVDQAVTALRAERYAEAVSLARRALALDPKQPGAKKVITTAVVKTAPGEVKALLDRYLQAVKKADLKSFYSQSGTPEFYQRIKKETEVIFKSYDEIQVTTSGLEVNVKESSFDQYAAEAAFFQIITARNRDKGPRQILFDGRMVWTLKNNGDGWKISEIAAASKVKK